MTTKTKDGRDSAHKPKPNTYGAVNFILQFKAFQDKAAQDRLKSTVKDVYLSLFRIWNDCGWLNEFTATYGRVMSQTGIGSDNTYYAALKELAERGYIIYTPSPNQYQASAFQLIILYEQEATENTNSGERKDLAPAQPKAEDFEGLPRTMLQSWKNWSEWLDSNEYLAELKRVRKQLTPRELSWLLDRYDNETIQIKCEEAANKVGLADRESSVFMVLKQYLRMHTERDY